MWRILYLDTFWNLELSLFGRRTVRRLASALGLRSRPELLVPAAGRVGSAHAVSMNPSLSGFPSPGSPDSSLFASRARVGLGRLFTGVRVDYSSRLLRACIRPHDGGLVVSSSPPLLAHRILSKPRRNAHGLARSIKTPSWVSEGGGSCPESRPNPSHSTPSLLAHQHAAAKIVVL